MLLNCGATRTSILCWWAQKIAQQLWKIVWQFLIKLKIHLSYELVSNSVPKYSFTHENCRRMSTQKPKENVYSFHP